MSVGGDIALGIGAGMRWGERGSRPGRTSASAGLVLPWAMSRRHRRDSLTTNRAELELTAPARRLNAQKNKPTAQHVRPDGGGNYTERGIARDRRRRAEGALEKARTRSRAAARRRHRRTKRSFSGRGADSPETWRNRSRERQAQQGAGSVFSWGTVGL